MTRYGVFKLDTTLPDIEQVCSGPAKGNRLKMIPPLTLTAISRDGCGRSVVITVEAARVTVQ